MAEHISIKAGCVELRATLNETATACAIVEALPILARANRWGGEVYFTIPVEVALDGNARDVVECGEIGYWPAGMALCIFFGRTPTSEGDEPRAASAVNIVGRVEGGLEELWNVADGDKVSVRRISKGS